MAGFIGPGPEIIIMMAFVLAPAWTARGNREALDIITIFFFFLQEMIMDNTPLPLRVDAR